MFNIHRVQLDWGGRKLTLETGRLARQADGAVFASYGETTVLAAVVAAKQPKEKLVREVTIPETITIQELANRMAERAVDVIRILCLLYTSRCV